MENRNLELSWRLAKRALKHMGYDQAGICEPVSYEENTYKKTVLRMLRTGCPFSRNHNRPTQIREHAMAIGYALCCTDIDLIFISQSIENALERTKVTSVTTYPAMCKHGRVAAQCCGEF